MADAEDQKRQRAVEDCIRQMAAVYVVPPNIASEIIGALLTTTDSRSTIARQCGVSTGMVRRTATMLRNNGVGVPVRYNLEGSSPIDDARRRLTE